MSPRKCRYCHRPRRALAAGIRYYTCCERLREELERRDEAERERRREEIRQ
jgi:hypothetical protein